MGAELGMILNAKGILGDGYGKQSSARKPTGTGPSAYDLAVLADSPVGYYKMDDTSGATMTDSSGNANDGTYNAVSYSATRVAEDGGLAITLAGASTSYCDISVGLMDLATSTSPKSFELWFRTTDTVGPLMVGRGPTGTPIMGMYIGNNGLTADNGKILCLVRDNGGGGLTELKSPLTYNDGAAHHVVWVFDGGGTKNWRMYVDSTDVVNGAHLMGSGVTTNDHEIGRDPISAGGSPHFTLAGDVDNCAIYDSALSSTRVTAHYNEAN